MDKAKQKNRKWGIMCKNLLWIIFRKSSKSFQTTNKKKTFKSKMGRRKL